MSDALLTVDAAAATLQMHPKTVLRHIRDGRLRATKLGRQYRVLRSDLNAFAGAGERKAAREARVTSIVDIEDVDEGLRQRLTSVLLGASQGKEPAGASFTLNIAHDEARGCAKVIMVGSPGDVALLLNLIGVCLEARP